MYSTLLLLALSAQADAIACDQLVDKNPHASFLVSASVLVEATDDLPAFCQIQGTIKPNIGFEARFPQADWNGNFFQTGCGGFCGVLNADRERKSNAINYALRRGYASIITDGGHKSEHTGDGSWAKNNPVAEKVYAEEVVPLTFEAGHRLVELIYNDKPRYSYFSGCSNGGRMAAIAAQRYPKLFDGIVAGCSVLNLSMNGGVYGAWVLQTNADDKGESILTHTFNSKLLMLEANALTQCDAVDGNDDGIISAPFSCAINLDAIPSCKEANTDSCLTDIEKRVVNDLYQGPVNSAGEAVFYGVPPGSERYWGLWFLGTEEYPGAGTLLADGYGKYLAFIDDREDYSALDFNFDTDIALFASQGELFNALDPDLSAFKKAGGKLIMWHGMADPLVLPQQSQDYLELVQTLMGVKDTHSFYRLFMAPGLGHCWDLPAATPDQMDLLGALERWVEQDIAPDGIAVTQFADDGAIVRRGVLRPFPQVAEYSDLLNPQ
jgi:feruloyl esterase